MEIRQLRGVNEDHGLEALLNPGEAEDFFTVRTLQPLAAQSGTAFDRDTACWLAEFSRLMYRRERDELPNRPAAFRTRDQLLTAQGWRETVVFHTDRGVPQGALFRQRDTDTSVLVFRGTLGVPDLLTDAHWVLQPWPGRGSVHSGFKLAHAVLWPQLQTALRDLRGRLFVTGHSLGGALATMTAALCRQELRSLELAGLYTFGSPRVGDHAFGAALDDVPHFRIVNDADIIPRLPPAITNPVLPYFMHTGSLHHLIDGNLRVYSRGLDPFAEGGEFPSVAGLQPMLAVANRATGSLPPFLSDHSPVNYLAKLDALVGT